MYKNKWLKKNKEKLSIYKKHFLIKRKKKKKKEKKYPFVCVVLNWKTNWELANTLLYYYPYPWPNCFFFCLFFFFFQICYFQCTIIYWMALRVVWEYTPQAMNDTQRAGWRVGYHSWQVQYIFCSWLIINYSHVHCNTSLVNVIVSRPSLVLLL